jgi:hypothetical protein
MLTSWARLDYSRRIRNSEFTLRWTEGHFYSAARRCPAIPAGGPRNKAWESPEYDCRSRNFGGPLTKGPVLHNPPTPSDQLGGIYGGTSKNRTW